MLTYSFSTVITELDFIGLKLVVTFFWIRCKRDKLKRSTRQGTDIMIAPRLNKQLQRLQSQAKNRNCTLRILPPHFSRRKENTSIFDYKQKVSRPKLHFVQFPDRPVKVQKVPRPELELDWGCQYNPTGQHHHSLFSHLKSEYGDRKRPFMTFSENPRPSMTLHLLPSPPLTYSNPDL